MTAVDLFSVDGKVAVVTGGSGALGGAMVRGLAAAGARVGILGRRELPVQLLASEIEVRGGSALPLRADVLIQSELQEACDAVVDEWGRIDILVNAAGGNQADATISGDVTFFTLTPQALDAVVRLNLHGSILPAQVFGRVMVRQGAGSIINVSSMAGQRSLTRVMGYGAAKAAIDNFTRWLAVELAQKYSPALRVNAIAPGFFIGEQNRRLLVHEDGSPTDRGRRILEHTPMRRFGEPDDLLGTLLWLASDASAFVTGTVVPVDGGYSAFGGV